MNLTHLSMYRCKRGSGKHAVPQVPTLQARHLALRAVLPAEPGNGMDWERLRMERAGAYAVEAMATHPSAEDVREGFRFKYGSE